MKTLRFKKLFTLLEILVVIAIIGILAGILLPSVMKSKEKAKSVRWLAFNEHWNRDGDTVLNYNFEYNGYTVKYEGSVFPGVRNGAIGCNVPGFEPPLYDGLLVGNPEFKKRCGRWKTNNAIQFDGVNDFIFVPGAKALDFDPAKDDFTIIIWFNPDNINASTKTFFSKADLPSGTQYDASLDAQKISFGLGAASTSAQSSDIKAGRWTNLAVRCNNGKSSIFINGVRIGGTATASTDSFDTSSLAMMKLPLELLSFAQSGNANSNSSNANSNASGAGNSGNSNAGGNSSGAGNSGSSNAGGNSGGGTTTVQSTSGAKFVLGAYGITGTSTISGTTVKVQNTSYYFQGMFDEVIVIKRALSDKEIVGIFRMGDPY